ncbi:MAG: biotin--[acetyl-CoA-carboxylase] ligase [Planctomycetes bacterium]|nr:biotin--[acetyl-CoA-carboxylase] ligase [Planctomycetota bacterium]
MNLALIQFLKKQSEFTPVAEVEAALLPPPDKKSKYKAPKPKTGKIAAKAAQANDALFRDVEELIEAGYNIEFHPYLGVRLIDIPDRLLDHEILDDLNTKAIGRKLYIYDSVASTNETAWKLITSKPDLKDGAVVLAEAQTEGRGRMGNEWHSAEGAGLWMSVICKVAVPPDKLPFLTAMASLALANMLQQFIHLPSEIKWPNDITIRGRKAAGVLVEARSNVPDTFVMGIGLNVNQTTSDFPENLRNIATSLRMERPGNSPLNRVRVLRPLLFYLDSVYQLVHKKKFDKIARAWGEFVQMGGKHVRLKHNDAEFTGIVKELDPAKGITLKLDEDGTEKLFSAESVGNVREVPAEPKPS